MSHNHWGYPPPPPPYYYPQQNSGFNESKEFYKFMEKQTRKWERKQEQKKMPTKKGLQKLEWFILLVLLFPIVAPAYVYLIAHMFR
jgi:hypothetical protein